MRAIVIGWLPHGEGGAGGSSDDDSAGSAASGANCPGSSEMTESCAEAAAVHNKRAKTSSVRSILGVGVRKIRGLGMPRPAR